MLSLLQVNLGCLICGQDAVHLPGVIIPTIPPTPQQFTCPLLMPVLSPVKKHSFRGVGTTCIRQWMYIDFKRRIIVAHQPPIKLLCGLIEV